MEVIRDHGEMKEMKKVKWEYEIQEMKEENYEIYHGTIVMVAGTNKTK